MCRRFLNHLFCVSLHQIKLFFAFLRQIYSSLLFLKTFFFRFSSKREFSYLLIVVVLGSPLCVALDQPSLVSSGTWQLERQWKNGREGGFVLSVSWSLAQLANLSAISNLLRAAFYALQASEKIKQLRENTERFFSASLFEFSRNRRQESINQESSRIHGAEHVFSAATKLQLRSWIKKTFAPRKISTMKHFFL